MSYFQNIIFNNNVFIIADIYVSSTGYLFWLLYIRWCSINIKISFFSLTDYKNILIVTKEKYCQLSC